MRFLIAAGIGFGLSMDAFSIALSKGLATKKVKLRDGVKIGAVFGGFQALMPLLGWTVGKMFTGIISKDSIDRYDHWIAFLLMFVIGVKMIIEAFKSSGGEAVCDLSFRCLTVFGIATSIDALVTGLALASPSSTLALILVDCLIIGGITFVVSAAGFIFGSRLGGIIGSKSGIIGGVVLILIGVKMLIEGLL